ncbi:hypothetical protein PYCC9005_001782 [Savitreella phatthalungensis]
MDLKTVDISESDAHTAAQVVQAAKSLGFIYITGHGISRELLERVWIISRDLFALPEDEKRKYAIGPDNRGWSCIGSETLDPEKQVGADQKEAFNLDVERESARPVPQLLREKDSDLTAFKQGCADIVQRLCRLFAIGLELNDVDFFSRRHNAERLSGTTLRLLYYPELKHELRDGEARAGAHTDYGSMTLLFQKPGQSGLEIATSAQSWSPVPPPAADSRGELPILVNIADQLQLWTSGVLRSTMHRVTATYTGDRYSIAYFAHPDDDTILEAIDELPAASTVPVSRITAGAHLRNRLAATYSYETEVGN